MGKLYNFIIVSPHQSLSADDEQKSPYPSKPGFLGAVVYSQQPESYGKVLIEPEQIIAHIPYYSRPSGTFDIEKGTMVLINSLHRNKD